MMRVGLSESPSRRKRAADLAVLVAALQQGRFGCDAVHDRQTSRRTGWRGSRVRPC